MFLTITLNRFIIDNTSLQKYIRPLYKSLYRSNMGKHIAIGTFLTNKDVYHPIAAKMIAIDLKVAIEGSSSPSSMNTLLLTGVAIAVAGTAIAVVRRSRK